MKESMHDDLAGHGAHGRGRKPRCEQRDCEYIARRSAEQRLHALLALLVRRLGRRCGAWCDLPFRLTHERICELIGTTRVTTTRLISRIRQAQLIEVPSGEAGLRLAPVLVESAPLAAA
jgi:CRP-like cAMP-binding protein